MSFTNEQLKNLINLGFYWGVGIAKDVSVVQVGTIQSVYFHRADAEHTIDNLNRIYNTEGAFELVDLAKKYYNDLT